MVENLYIGLVNYLGYHYPNSYGKRVLMVWLFRSFIYSIDDYLFYIFG